MDDILIYSKNFDVLIQLAEEVFSRLNQCEILINLEKSQFGYKRLLYLGQIIGEGRMTPDTKQVRILRSLKVPMDITELRGLIGIIDYFQKYIPNYSKIMQPLFSLLPTAKSYSVQNKTIRVRWNEELEKVRIEVLNILADAVLQIPLDGDQFLIKTDVSDAGIAAVLSVEKGDELLPIEFYSKTFFKFAKN